MAVFSITTGKFVLACEPKKGKVAPKKGQIGEAPVTLLGEYARTGRQRDRTAGGME
jgi:hypothetical protein